MKLIGVALAAALVAAPAGLQAQERAAVKDGFELAASSGKRILILRPSVSVGAQSTGGMFEPNADWTEQARTNLAASLAKWQSQLGNEVVPVPVTYGGDELLVEEYMALFQAIASSVIAGMTGAIEQWVGTPASASLPNAANRLSGDAARGSSFAESRGSRLVTEIATATSRWRGRGRPCDTRRCPGCSEPQHNRA